MENLAAKNPTAVRTRCRIFGVPTPDPVQHPDNCTYVYTTDRLAFAEACCKLEKQNFNGLFDSLAGVDPALAREVKEDVVETILAIMENESEIQEQADRSIPLDTREANQ